MNNNVEIAYGGASVKNGTGGLGGSVLLQNKVNWNKKLEVDVNQYYGSFQDTRSNISIRYGNKKIQSAIKVVYSSSLNNFPYLNITKQDMPTENQVNSRVSLYHIMQDLHYKWNKKNTVEGSVWHFKNERQIPPTLNTIDYSGLVNQSSRGYLAWKHINKSNSYFELRSAYSHDYVHFFEDTLSNINSEHLGQSWNSQFNWHQQIKKITVKSGLEHKIEYSLSDGYQDGKYRSASDLNYLKRNITSLFSDFKIRSINKWLINIHIRELLIDEGFSPLIYSLSSENKMLSDDKLNWKASYVKNFNMPSMYDLYWDKGGNSDLVPEEGWIAESGFSSKFILKNNIEVRLEGTAYVSKINNWILWQPIDGYNWSAQNLKEVYREGGELSASIKGDLGKLKYNLNGVYGYVNAVNKSKIGESDASFGKQLIYVPKHNFQSFIRILYKDMSLTYEYSYTGSRFITTDNSWYMPAFGISNIVTGTVLKSKNFKFDIKFRVYNILNAQYQTIPYRPMPGRYYGISLGVYWLKQNKKEE
ncbi:MAG: hypothetical protein HRT72_13015 [Flavobacteriales bacterium]|nr:hypothetical protein [Flavobacteriales bacterium]